MTLLVNRVIPRTHLAVSHVVVSYVSVILAVDGYTVRVRVLGRVTGGLGVS